MGKKKTKKEKVEVQEQGYRTKDIKAFNISERTFDIKGKAIKAKSMTEAIEKYEKMQ